VIVGLIEGFIAYKAIQVLVGAAQTAFAIAQEAWAATSIIRTVAWTAVQIAATLALAAYEIATWAATAALAALGSPVLLIIAAVVALGVAFKALYDSGWTVGTAFDAIKDNLKRFGMNLMDLVDKMLGLLPQWAGGLSDEEKAQRAKIREAARAELDAAEKDRDAKRAETRKERGTEDSLLNMSGKKEETKPNDKDKKPADLAAMSTVDTSKLTSAQKDQMVRLSPRTTTAATAKAVDPKEAERQRLIDERTNQILGVSSKSNPTMPNNPTLAAVQGPQPGAEKPAEKESNKKSEEASNTTADAVVATATKADEALKISYQQVATLNTVSDQLTVLNEVMKEILKLHHDQIDTQKDLVNVTKGKYSPI
jgi:hypothetical protein